MPFWSLYLSARWRQWADGDADAGRDYGWLELCVNGVPFTTIAMAPWNTRRGKALHPGGTEVSRAVAVHLGEMLS